MTDSTGNSRVDRGSYTIRAALQGFKTAEALVLVEVAQTVHQNLTLEVGATQETITVSGERAPLLQTETAEVGQRPCS